MTIYGLFRRIVRNDAIKVDPQEIYNWRVIALAASVSALTTASCVERRCPRLMYTFAGMLCWSIVRSRRWYYWRRVGDARLQKVRIMPNSVWYMLRS